MWVYSPFRALSTTNLGKIGIIYNYVLSMAYLKKATCFTFASTKTGTEKEEDKRKTKFYKNENFI